MRPPVLGLLPKVVPAGGDTLGGRWVPGGTNICSNTGALLRSRSLFGPDADVFRPERSTDLGETARRREMERNVEFAFGSGQWQCVGRRIAFMKLSKTVFEVDFIPYLSEYIATIGLNLRGFRNWGIPSWFCCVAGAKRVFSQKVFGNFDLQLISPIKPCDVESYAVFLESDMFVKVTESTSDLSVA